MKERNNEVLLNKIEEALEPFRKEGNYKIIPKYKALESIEKLCEVFAEELYIQGDVSVSSLTQLLVKFTNDNTGIWGIFQEKGKEDEDGNKYVKRVTKYITYHELMEEYGSIINAIIKKAVFPYVVKKIPHKSDIRRFINALQHLSPNWAADTLPEAYTALRCFFENIYYNLNFEGATKQAYCLFLVQERHGGGGKGVFIEGLTEVLRKYGLIVVGNEDFPQDRFNTMSSASSHVVIFNDKTKQSWKKRNIGYYNNIIDNDEYSYEAKGQDKLLVKSKATHIVTTNEKLEDLTNNRRQRYIYYTPRVLRPGAGHDVIEEEYLKKYFDCYPYEGNDKDDNYKKHLLYWMEEAFLSCPFGYTFKFANTPKIKEKLPETFQSVISGILCLKEKIKNEEVELKNKKGEEETLNDLLLSFFIENTEFKKEGVTYWKKFFGHLKATLAEKRFGYSIKTGGKPYPFWRIDFERILEIGVEDRDNMESIFENETDNLQEQWLQAHNLIGRVSLPDMPPYIEPNDKPTIEKHENKDFTEAEKEVQEFIDTYSLGVCPHRQTNKVLNILNPGENYMYLINGKNIAGKRRKENTEPKMFIYEIDTISKEEQEKIINRILNSPYKDNIASITWSGSKSYHILVYHNEGAKIKDDYNYYWAKIGKTIFCDDFEKFDINCAKVGHMTRCFNMKRYNENKQHYFEGEQTKYYISLNAKPIDLSFLIKERLLKKVEENISKMDLTMSFSYQNMYKGNSNNNSGNSNNNSILDEDKKLKNTVKKHPNNKNYQIALSILNGNVPKGINIISILKSLHSSGFSDKWIEDKIFSPAKNAHPTNIPKSFPEYKKYL